MEVPGILFGDETMLRADNYDAAAANNYNVDRKRKHHRHHFRQLSVSLPPFPVSPQVWSVLSMERKVLLLSHTSKYFL